MMIIERSQIFLSKLDLILTFDNLFGINGVEFDFQ